jgi:hypothetical protein
MNRFLIVAAMIAALMLTVTLPAEADSVSTSLPFSVGNSSAGASGQFTASASTGTKTWSAALRATADVRALGYTAKAIDAQASLTSSGGTRSASFKLTLGKATVDSQARNVSWTWARSMPWTILTVTAPPIFVGPVPVTVRGTVGGGLSGSISLALKTSGVGLSGALSSWVSGSARAGIGIPGYNVSIQATLELLRSTLSAGIDAGVKVAGFARVVREPLTILFDLVANAWPLTWTKSLAHYSYGRSDRLLFNR